MKSLCWLLVPLFFLSTAAFGEDFKHMQKGVQCVQCHMTESPAGKPKAKVCFNCHTYEAVREKTAAMPLNPHDAHVGEVRCNLCHREHSQSVVYCKECHKDGDPKFEFQTP